MRREKRQKNNSRISRRRSNAGSLPINISGKNQASDAAISPCLQRASRQSPACRAASFLLNYTIGGFMSSSTGVTITFANLNDFSDTVYLAMYGNNQLGGP